MNTPIPEVIYDESYDLNNLKKYVLYIELYYDKYIANIIDTENNKLIGYYNHPILYHNNVLLNSRITELKTFFNHEILRNNYKKQLVFIDTTHKTLIPKSLYLPDEKNEYLSVIFDKKQNKSVLYNTPVFINNSVMIYGIDKEFSEIITQNYSEPLINCKNAVTIAYLLSLFKNTETTNVCVDVKTDYIDIIVLNGNNLLLQNSFEYKTEHDFVYYVLLVYDYLKLNNEINMLYIMGNIEKNTQIVELLKKYIKHIDFFTIHKDLKITYKLNKYPMHYWFGLNCMINYENNQW